MCVFEKERETVCVFEKERETVCVFEKEREREKKVRVFVRERE